jgi:hypothetical protein
MEASSLIISGVSLASLVLLLLVLLKVVVCSDLATTPQDRIWGPGLPAGRRLRPGSSPLEQGPGNGYFHLKPSNPLGILASSRTNIKQMTIILLHFLLQSVVLVFTSSQRLTFLILQVLVLVFGPWRNILPAKTVTVLCMVPITDHFLQLIWLMAYSCLITAVI